MELALNINGDEKIFVVSFVSMRMLRKTLEIGKNTDFTDIDTGTLDELADYVVELFGKQFTRDELYDGLPSKEVFPMLNKCIAGVLGEMDESTEPLQDSKN